VKKGESHAELAGPFGKAGNRAGIQWGPVTTYEWTFAGRRDKFAGMQDSECKTAADVRVPGSISVGAAHERTAVSRCFALTLKLVVCGFAFFPLLVPALAENAAANSPMFRGNAQHSGVYDAAGVAKFERVSGPFMRSGN
jgi:hypothetical protein